MTDKINPILPTNPVDSPTNKGNPQPVDSAEFRRILERLESLSPTDAAPAEARLNDTEEFLDAMRKADDDFTSVMDLRRKLEDAYRKGQP